MCAWLREFNESCNGGFMRSLRGGAETPFFLVAKEGGRLLGGLAGQTLHLWTRIDLMAVAPDHRRRGIGTLLVESAINRGRRAGCRHCYVDTMSYQAPEFYEGLGFREAGRLVNWDSHGHDKVFFTRSIGDSP